MKKLFLIVIAGISAGLIIGGFVLPYLFSQKSDTAVIVGCLIVVGLIVSGGLSAISLINKGDRK